MDFDSVLNHAKEKAGISAALGSQQTEALRALYAKKDVLCLLPRGDANKSAIYKLAPFLLSSSPSHDGIIIIITAMNDIMKGQIRQMSESGVSACYVDVCSHSETLRPLSPYSADSSYHPDEKDKLEWEFVDSDDESVDSDDSYGHYKGHYCKEQDYDSEDENERVFENPQNSFWDIQKNTDASVTVEELQSGKFNLVYAHPDAFLLKWFGKVMRSCVYRDRVCCVAVDEASMTCEWSEDFRRDYQRVLDARSLFSTKPVVVLTANSDPAVQEDLIKRLSLPDVVKVTAAVDWSNIKFIKKERPPRYDCDSAYLEDILDDMATYLRAQRDTYPFTIVYFQDITHTSNAYIHLCAKLGKDVYLGESNWGNRMVQMYHGANTVSTRDAILKEINQPVSKIRVLFSMAGLCLGLDLPVVRQVIHFGVPLCIETYLQQVGQAGRDGLPSSATLYYRKTMFRKRKPKRYMKPFFEHDKTMVDYCLSKGQCLRELLLTHIGCPPPADRRLCDCCVVCQDKCKCGTCK